MPVYTFVLISRSFQTIFFSKPAVCWFIVTNVKKKNIKHFYTPSIFTFMKCKELKKILVIGNIKKTWPVTLFGPLAAIWNFAQKCEQTAISQELSMVNKFCLHVLWCLNYWDDKNFWGAQSVPPSPATSVK